MRMRLLTRLCGILYVMFCHIVIESDACSFIVMKRGVN